MSRIKLANTQFINHIENLSHIYFRNELKEENEENAGNMGNEQKEEEIPICSSPETEILYETIQAEFENFDGLTKIKCLTDYPIRKY